MSSSRPLPARVVPFPDESLTSIIRRTALAMGYDQLSLMAQLLPDRRSPVWQHVSRGPTLSQLEILLQQPADMLLQGTYHRFAPDLVRLPAKAAVPDRCDTKTILRYFPSRVLVCPECLAGPEAYERLLWGFRPLPVCLDHRILLANRCSHCHRAFSAKRLDACRCRCGFDVRDGPRIPLSDSARQILTSQRDWLVRQESPLAGMSTAASFSWADRLVLAVVRTPAWIQSVQERHQLGESAPLDLIAWLSAAEILIRWPSQFEDFLDQFQRVGPYQGANVGIRRWFGPLLHDASQLELDGYGVPAEVLRTYLLARYTRGHLNARCCLFRGMSHRQLTEQREWLTQMAAARQLGVRNDAIPQLVRSGALQARVNPAGSRSTILVSQGSIERLQRQRQMSISFSEAARRLGLAPTTVVKLLRAGLFTGAERTATVWQIPRNAVDNLLQVYARLPLCDGQSDHWLPLRKACRRGYSHGVTVAWLLAQFLKGVLPAGRVSGQRNLRGLRIRDIELQSLLVRWQSERERTQGYPLNRLERRLVPGRRLGQQTLLKWVRAGLLRTTSEGRVTAEEMERFRGTYCLTAEASKILGITRDLLHRWVTRGVVTAAFRRRTNTGAGISIFHRDEIVRLAAEQLHRRTAGSGSK